MTTVPKNKDQREFGRLLTLARVGDSQAQYEVALMYANGVGVKKDLNQAVVWTEAAAKKGHPAAQYLLGTAYQGGLGVKRNILQALTWLLKAADSGSDKAPMKLARLITAEGGALVADLTLDAAQRGVLEAQWDIAQRLVAGDLVDPEAAAHTTEWLQNAAEGGIAAAQFALGQQLANQFGKDKGLRHASKWFRLAAGQGHPGAYLALRSMDAEGFGRSKLSARDAERRAQGQRWDLYAAHATVQEQFNLGRMYQEGWGVVKSSKLARKWFELAALGGLMDAQIALADMLRRNAPEISLRWYTLAAAQGSADAQFAVGQYYENSSERPDFLEQALAFYSQATAQGHARANQELAQLLNREAPNLALTFLEASARSGQPEAQYKMGARYATGSGVDQDWLKAADWYARAAEQGHADAQCALADCLKDGLGIKKDVNSAVRWYERAADQDHARAQWILGELLVRGSGEVAADPAKAALYCKRAANAGFAPAQSTMGALFAKAKKYERAAHWWSLAADQNDPEALFNLAHAHRMGWVKSREDEGLILLQRAAATGLAAAQARLGLCYATGEHAPLDPIEAAKWFVLASEGGDESAVANKKRAEATLTPAQWREALRRARNVSSQ